MTAHGTRQGRVALASLNPNGKMDDKRKMAASASTPPARGYMRANTPIGGARKIATPATAPPARQSQGGFRTGYATPKNATPPLRVDSGKASDSPAEATPGHHSATPGSTEHRRGTQPTPFTIPKLSTPPSVQHKQHVRPQPQQLKPPQTAVAQAPSPTAPKRKYLIPAQASEFQGKITLVFDLDETLVSNRRPGAQPAIPRHYLFHMFQMLKGSVEIVLWTASTEDTGRPVVQQIDPKGEVFQHVIYRNSQWFTDVSHTKDLTLLGRDMDKVIIVENTPNCCKFNPQNAIMVEDFVGDLSKQDRTLLGVVQIIRGAVESVAKRISIQRYLKYYSKVPGCAIDLYELGLPPVYAKLGKEEAMRRIAQLDPLMRPPLGLYYYVNGN